MIIRRCLAKSWSSSAIAKSDRRGSLRLMATANSLRRRRRKSVGYYTVLQQAGI